MSVINSRWWYAKRCRNSQVKSSITSRVILLCSSNKLMTSNSMTGLRSWDNKSLGCAKTSMQSATMWLDFIDIIRQWAYRIVLLFFTLAFTQKDCYFFRMSLFLLMVICFSFQSYCRATKIERQASQASQRSTAGTLLSSFKKTKTGKTIVFNLYLENKVIKKFCITSVRLFRKKETKHRFVACFERFDVTCILKWYSTIWKMFLINQERRRIQYQ